MKRLAISPDLSLPLDFVTNTQAILAKRRAGKSYTASVQAEEMLKAGQRIIVIDPTGAWWGLKASADGRGPGFPILIAGGRRADIPIEPGAGRVLARAVCADRFSVILDLKGLDEDQLLAFVADFLETIYAENAGTVHVFADEADAYAPQSAIGKAKDAARALKAMNNIVRRGGISGIGCTLVSQRPAVVNKDVLTQCEVLTVLRMVHPADVAAVMAWVKLHATPDEAARVLADVPTLPIGTAYFWSPSWPEDKPIGVTRVAIRKRETFDSGRTPKPGENVAAPRQLAAPDVEKLGERIRALATQAKENDPAEIRRQLDATRAELAELKRRPPPGPPAPPPPEPIKVSVVRADDARALRAAVEQLATVAGRLGDQLAAARRDDDEAPLTPRQARVASNGDAGPAPVPTPAAPKPPTAAAAAAGVNEYSQAILDAAERLRVYGMDPLPARRVAALAGKSAGSSTWERHLAALRGAGLIDYDAAAGRDAFRLTPAGRAAANPVTTPATPAAMFEGLLGMLSDYEQKIARALRRMIEADGEALAKAAGVSGGSSTWERALAKMKQFGILTYVDGRRHVRIADDLLERQEAR